MDICTIIASNYVAAARVLAESFRAHHADGRVFVLVVDDWSRRIDPAQEPFELVTPAQIGVEDFDRMAVLYSVLELSTAVKPWLLKWLLTARGAQELLYLDPDIEIHGSLDELGALLREHQLVVTPHLTAPMPRDGRKPSETDILIAGSYNLGFIGVAPGPDTERLLDWWSERLKTDCIVAPERGLFVDQRWMDFMPGLVPSFYVLRDPGYNVAYWNLPTRKLGRAGDGYTVDGRPLRFFHYSGFDPAQPHKLSLHQDRIEVAADPVLKELCERYAQRLLARGHAAAQRWPYTYSRLVDGTPVDAVLRRAVREAFATGAVRANVLTPQGAREVVRWARDPAPRGGDHGVNRYLLALWESRPDLQALFPTLEGVDGPRFLAWAETFGRAEVPIPPAMLTDEGVDGGGGVAVPPTGVNVVGYLGAVLGVGEAGRQYAHALETQGIEVERIGLHAGASRQDPALGPSAGGRPRFPFSLVAVNADVFPEFAADAGPEFFRDRYTIGHWAWEVPTFPDRFAGAFQYVDELWVGSQFVAETLQPVSPVPVVKIREPVATPRPQPMSRAELGLPDEGFLFYFSFDYNSVFARKNPMALVRAFCGAFAPGEGPQLVIKSINHERDTANRDRLLEAAAGRPDIHFIERHVPREERDALTAACDCYVSLHRSEGYGYTVAEAMALGKPVIATGWSGTMEFTTPRNAFLVDHELVAVGAGADPYPPDAEWAEPDAEHAGRLMREVLENPEEAARRGQRAAADALALLSPEAVGRAMVERLSHIALGAALGRANGAGPLGAGVVQSQRLRDRIATGPIPPRSPRFGKPQVAARKALLRTLKPFTVHERMVDTELVHSLEQLDHSMQSLALASKRRLDDLAGQVDQLRLDVNRALGFMEALGAGAVGLDLTAYPDAPAQPWTQEWVDAHREWVTRALGDPALLNVFRAGWPLPAGYAVGFDERLIEFPWTATRNLAGRALDAGSTLNHPHVLMRLRPRVDELHIVTLAPEEQAFPYLDISYVYADLRDLPFKDGVYDCATCISTLEHVGMDNTQYGAPGAAAPDPEAERARALRELRRVLRPGGVLYLTVPFGRPDDLGWQQIFDAERLERLVAAFEPSSVEREHFLYEPGGWRRASAEECAGAVYRDHTADPAPAGDRAVAARALACLTLTA